MRYSAYPEYKDSGVEWLGEIPEGWEVRRLKFLASEPLKYGANESAELDDRELPRYIRITDVNEDGSLNESTFRSIPHEIAKEYLLNNGDILLARSGATVGKSFQYFDSWGIAAFAGYLIRFRVDTSIFNPRYAYYYFRNKGYWGWIDSILVLATIQNVSAEKYASAILPLPKIDEQKSIALFLDKKTSQIDELIKKKNELIEKLKEQRMALITTAVTKGLDDSVPMKDSGVDWLGEIPEGWECSSLKWFIRTTSGEFISNTEIDSELSEITPVPIIGGNGIMAYCNKINNEPNSIVVGRVGAYCGNVHFIKEHSWVTDNALLITIIGKEYSLDYLYWYLKSLNLNSFANKNAQPLITGEIVKNQTAVIPSLAEQKSIAEYLDEKTAKIDALIEKVEKAIEKLKEYRITLITDAVTGKIKV